ncbi:hypothetical protein Hanom_Chr12g01168211 [Helianthus anomalus]
MELPVEDFLSRVFLFSVLIMGSVVAKHRGFAEVKKQTIFFLQTTEVWSTFSAADVCRCGPQTTDVLPLKK